MVPVIRRILGRRLVTVDEYEQALREPYYFDSYLRFFTDNVEVYEATWHAARHDKCEIISYALPPSATIVIYLDRGGKELEFPEGKEVTILVEPGRYKIDGLATPRYFEVEVVGSGKLYYDFITKRWTVSSR